MRAIKIIISGGITLVLLISLTFFLSQWVPIDPTLSLVADSASSSSYSEAREALGVDKPLLSQITTYFTKIFTGDFGCYTFCAKV